MAVEWGEQGPLDPDLPAERDDTVTQRRPDGKGCGLSNVQVARYPNATQEYPACKGDSRQSRPLTYGSLNVGYR